MAGASQEIAVELAPSGQLSAIGSLDPSAYSRHALHGAQCAWVEKNCYADFWIEVLHAKGFEPLAMLPFVVNVDFEEDQWTFFKPSHDELRSLYGVKVHELTMWRPLRDHVVEHLAMGRLVSMEVDAFGLPDTAGTDYQTKHSKTTIAINQLDMTRRTLGYFHNAGYFELSGEDFDQLLSLETPITSRSDLPLYAELITFIRPDAQSVTEMKRASLDIMRKQLQYVPETNPVQRFAQRFARDLPWLQSNGLDHYHTWAFAGIRQWGSAFELAAAWVDWMQDTLGPRSEEAKTAFNALSLDAKTLILKGARAVASKKPFDPVDQLAKTALVWQHAMDSLAAAVEHAFHQKT